jgi:hypothetical protein
MDSLRLKPSSTVPSTRGSGAVAVIWGAKKEMAGAMPRLAATIGVHAPAAMTRRAARTRPFAVSSA